MKYKQLFTCILMTLTFAICKGQDKTNLSFSGPKAITRNLIQDKKGNIWMAAFDGVFRYDGKTFTNITANLTQARFFSVLEDSKGNFWFGSIGSGVYKFDGKTFKNFTIKDGLLNNDIGCIYEDKTGKIWFGVFGGASCYDGKSFANYILEGEAMIEDKSGKTFAESPPYEVNSIIEDKAGKLWFASRGNTFTYDGKKFTTSSYLGRPFRNVRTLIADHKGNIWLAGADGLWRFDGNMYHNYNKKFVGYIIEDSKGNIWTSSESSKTKDWALSRYDQKPLYDRSPAINEIYTRPMCFGILEAKDGSIWFGATDGVYRFDGTSIIDFKSPQANKPLTYFP